MSTFKVLIAVLLLGFLTCAIQMFSALPVGSSETISEFRLPEEIEDSARGWTIDPALLHAIVWQESSYGLNRKPNKESHSHYCSEFEGLSEREQELCSSSLGVGQVMGWYGLNLGRKGNRSGLTVLEVANNQKTNLELASHKLFNCGRKFPPIGENVNPKQVRCYHGFGPDKYNYVDSVMEKYHAIKNARKFVG